MGIFDFIKDVGEKLGITSSDESPSAEALKKEVEPLKVLGILKRDISPLFFQATRAQMTHYALSPREVILSSWVVSSDRPPKEVPE